MSRRIAFVTGGAGFIGSNIAARLAGDRALDVVVCDWLGAAQDSKWRNLRKHPLGDFTQPERMFEWLAAHANDVEVVIHMGAISSTTEPDADRIIQTNFVLSRDLYRWCAEHGRRFIYASSAATYGDGALGFDDDNGPAALAALRPLNAYGWSKALFDLFAVRQAARGMAPPQWAGLKFFNVYGPNEEHKGPMKSVAAQIWPDVAQGRQVKLFKSYRPDIADGGQLRDFVYVRDAVDVVVWLASRPDVNGVYNLGSGRARSFRELAEAVFAVAGAEPQIEYVAMPPPLRDRYQYFTEARLERLRAAGYEGQFTSLEDGVADYVRGYLTQPDFPPVSELSAQACVSGGGPAGMMLGYLLARAGVDVIVLEKHGDFLRDFRGDTVHPSTMEVMRELGLLDEFLQRPHQRIDHLAAQIGDETVHVGDFRRLKLAAPFIALMPQWDFLNFLAEKAKAFPSFRLVMQAEVTELIREDGGVVGALAAAAGGELRISAPLVVGADGRHSTVRGRAGFEVQDLGAPMDVLWLRLPRREEDDDDLPLGRAIAGGILVMIPRGDYFQCGFVVPKGEAEAIKARGLPAFRGSIEAMAPAMRGRTDAIASWDDVKLLTVAVDRLKTWCAPGVLCIGDAAHAMSPVGGVGINLAIQDAVATANLLWAPLKAGAVSLAELQSVQRRREWPTKVTQAAQVFIQKRAIAPTLAGASPKAPWPAKLVDRFPPLQGLLARAVGMGVRFEQVRSPAA